MPFVQPPAAPPRDDDLRDRELVRRTLRGELDAFETLVTAHRDLVHRVAARMVGDSEAEDVTQDALLRAFHRLGSFRGDAPFRSWLLIIVRNTALNALARRKPVSIPEDAADSALDDRRRPRQMTPADALELSERRARLAGKIRLLRPQHRSVILLRHVEGLSYEEIAEVTEAPLGSVKTRLHRARRELIDLLRNNAYDWQLPNE